MSKFNQRKAFEALASLLKEKESEGYEIKMVSGKGDVMGDLLGYQFDSNQRGGYVYFWSSGIVGRQLLDYETGEEIIEDATDEMDEGAVRNLIDDLAKKLS